MKIQNIRVETSDNDQTMILCDVVKFELRKKIVIKNVAEYIKFNGENYELEYTDSNLDERLNQEEIYHIQSVFDHCLKTQKSIEELKQTIENCQKNYDIKRKILMYAKCSKLIALGHEKNQNCDRLIEALNYLENDIDSFIDKHTEHYIPISFIKKPNEHELEDYRAEIYQEYADKGYFTDYEEEEVELYFW